MTGIVLPACRARLGRGLSAVLVVSLMSGCNAFTRLSKVGSQPPLTQIQNPVKAPGYRPVTMPMPTPRSAHHASNSLWRPGARAFFRDQRASRIGDILTVMIEIDDRAETSNTTTRSRKNSEDAGATNFLGLESRLRGVLPNAVSPARLIDLDSSTSNRGAGTVNRDETIELKIAAAVTQMLPNGNLVIFGRQEVRVNFEVRELQITGVIRRADITNANTISYEKIAEARISYGGRGHITDFQQPRYGQQVFDVLFPF